jgi:hypothetical protein
LESHPRWAGCRPEIVSICAWLSPPTVNRPGACASVRYSSDDPDRGELTRKIGRSNRATAVFAPVSAPLP